MDILERLKIIAESTSADWPTTSIDWEYREAVKEIARLREMIEAAKAEEREAIIAEMPGGHSVDPQWVCDMIRARKG